MSLYFWLHKNKKKQKKTKIKLTKPKLGKAKPKTLGT